MKRVVVFLGVVVALTSLCGLFGCNTQAESTPKSSVPGGGAAASKPGAAPTPGKKGQPEMPGP